MQVSRLTIENFRGIKRAELHFGGHTLLIGANNVGKSTICEALDLVLGPDRLSRTPPVQEFDFFNARYLSDDGRTPIPLRIEVVLTGLTDEIRRLCAVNLEFWNKDERRLLNAGEIHAADEKPVEFCLRIITIARYDADEDQFVATTVYGRSEGDGEEKLKGVPKRVKHSLGFFYLRALRTGTRALSLERGTLLDAVLRMKDVRTGLWERVRARLQNLHPSIDEDAGEIAPVLEEIETRLGEYVPIAGEERATRLFVSQLTREHLRKTISFFLKVGEGEIAVPFQEAGTGTLNTLVLALLTFIADERKDNVIFAMEEPEIALPPHAQRRIVNYLLTRTAQCFVTSHSPYVVERFEPKGILRLTRGDCGSVVGTPVGLPASMKAKTYRSQLRRAIAESMLGRGVIVGEGVTEQYALSAAAKKMEEANGDLFPLDLAGVTIVNTEGDGNLDAMGGFFQSLDIQAFAFYDRKKRTPEEIAKIKANFTLAQEIPQKGAEALMAEETPASRQWELLERVREEDADRSFGIPSQRPSDQDVRGLTLATLKGLKGDGGAARLIGLCSAEELPRTITAFLKQIYARFPKPRHREPETAPPVGDAAGTRDGDASGEVATPVGTAGAQRRRFSATRGGSPGGR
jgi:putative ATP-dependent endonuclease of OLD family